LSIFFPAAVLYCTYSGPFEGQSCLVKVAMISGPRGKTLRTTRTSSNFNVIRGNYTTNHARGERNPATTTPCFAPMIHVTVLYAQQTRQRRQKKGGQTMLLFRKQHIIGVPTQLKSENEVLKIDAKASTQFINTPLATASKCPWASQW
jgi:hypothetical protein